MVSVVQRDWAAKNTRATFKAPITVEDVLNSRMIAYPFRLLQCCLVTDGVGALILVAAERARDFPQKPVCLLGTGESGETPMVSQMADFTPSRAFPVAGPKAFAEAGTPHNDVNHPMIHGAPCSLPGASFAHLPIYGLRGSLPPGAVLCPAMEAPASPRVQAEILLHACSPEYRNKGTSRGLRSPCASKLIGCRISFPWCANRPIS
jgi:hypothetical protein